MTKQHFAMLCNCRTRESVRQLKAYLGDNYCSMVQSDIGRGRRARIQPLLLQAHAGGRGSSRGGCFLLLPGRQSAVAMKHAISRLRKFCPK